MEMGYKCTYSTVMLLRVPWDLALFPGCLSLGKATRELGNEDTFIHSVHVYKTVLIISVFLFPLFPIASLAGDSQW